MFEFVGAVRDTPQESCVDARVIVAPDVEWPRKQSMNTAFGAYSKHDMSNQDDQ